MKLFITGGGGYIGSYLVSSLLKIEPPQNLIFEDLPVEEAMKNFFEDPNKYIV